MYDQKAENLLNLALSTPETERLQTEDLNVGFNEKNKSWELIVKFSGNLQETLNKQFPTVKMQELLGGFAILEVPENLVEEIIDIEEIEYVEKPKRLFFAVNRARAASCFLPVQRSPFNLTGAGVLIGIVDSGIDYFHEDFRKEDGSSRILYLYDQVLERIFTKKDLDRALAMERPSEARTLVPSVDRSGHGTAVAGIAAGNGRASDGKYRGAAYESDLVVVRMGVSDSNGFPRTTQVMRGLDFIVRKSLELKKPVAMNLSFGNSYGSHDGDGLLERYIDRISEIGKNVVVAGTGNEGDKAGHVSGLLSLQTGNLQRVEWMTAPYETGFGLQLWKHYVDDFDIEIRNPGNTRVERIRKETGAYELDMDGTRILVYYGEPGPFSTAQEIYFDFLPENNYVESGSWSLTFVPIKIVDGRYDVWLPSAGVRNPATRFLRPTPDTTLTIPSTAERIIAVGAYDDSVNVYAPFSGRGDTRIGRLQKPDLVAPGVNIIAPAVGGGYEPVTGTSFAVPLVTGAAALLMEWGIVRGNDPYLYGEKIKAYLRKGAKPISGESEYPNPRVGYGALCVFDSFP